MRTELPTAAAYLASLPRGLDSHGDCTAFDVHERARRHVIEKVPAESLRPVLGPIVDASWAERWSPAVHGLAVQLALADRIGEAAYLRWIYDDARSLYDRPFVRHLMRLLSPSLVVMGCASRWGAMHRGSQLVATALRTGPTRVTGGAVLRYPMRLFPELFCRALAETFRAALDLAHAHDAFVTLVDHGDERASYEIGWAR